MSELIELVSSRRAPLCTRWPALAKSLGITYPISVQSSPVIGIPAPENLENLENLKSGVADPGLGFRGFLISGKGNF